MNIRTEVLLGAALFATATAAFAQGTGADTYKSKCAMCHGADGTASGPAGKAMNVHSFNSPDVVKESDADLIAIIQKGKNKMPAFSGKLTDVQITDALAYIHTLQKK